MYMGGLFLNGHQKAQKCADALTKKTGKQHSVKSTTMNLSDGFPARVLQTYYSVIEGKPKTEYRNAFGKVVK